MSNLNIYYLINLLGIESMIPQLESYIQKESLRPTDNTPLTRQEVIRALIKTSIKEDLRFQGVNLCGADLNHLDLRNINFKVSTYFKSINVFLYHPK